MALDVGGVLVPIAFAGAIMRFPSAFIPDEQEVVARLFPDPSVSAHFESFAPIVSILIGNGINAQSAQESLELLNRSTLLHQLIPQRR